MANIETIYFIHHTHTDIGYTHDQPIVWDLNVRFLNDVLDCAERGMSRDVDARFRWTVESSVMLSHWFDQASSKQIDRFVQLEKAGLIEVTAMFANITPLFDIDQLIETFQILRRLRNDYGLTIRHAMNCDVNGQSWSLVDLLLDLGIEGFMMAVNPHYGSPPFTRPSAFWWESPQGRQLLTWNGWLYISGWRFGIGHEDFHLFETHWLPLIEQYLDDINYPYRLLLIQSAHPFGDNGTAFLGFSDFIERWNEAGKAPRLKFATPSIWWNDFQDDIHLVPQYRGDWTDYWNFGCISSSREQAINRASRTRLRTADALDAINIPPEATSATRQFAHSIQRYRDSAWQHLHFWDEHTWGADQAVHQPDLDDTLSQWNHKAHYAYQARSLSFLLQRDGLAALASQVKRTQDDAFLLFNPLPWTRQIAGDIPAGILSERYLAWDYTSSRHYQDRLLDFDGLQLYTAKHSEQLNINATIPEILSFHPVEVPAFGYTLISQKDLFTLDERLTFSEEASIENHRYRLIFDTAVGGIQSLYDKQLDKEWVDSDSEYGFHQFIHETVANADHGTGREQIYEEVWHSVQVEYPDGWKKDWQAKRTGVSRVIQHQVVRTPHGITVIQQLEAEHQGMMISSYVFLPRHADYIDFKASWQMGLDTLPEATYMSFPFALPEATVHFDLGGQSVMPERDQLPGVCRDYFTVQNWVDFNNGDTGVSIATPDNPMVQLGDFHFGHRQPTFSLESALFLGWITNNYWKTNFRAHQAGEVRSFYRIQPYQGTFDEVKAHRFGVETAHRQPLLQHLAESMKGTHLYPSSSTLLILPGNNDHDTVVTLHILKQDENEILIRLINTSDSEQDTELKSGLLKIVDAYRCNLLGEKQAPLTVQDGKLDLTFTSRQIQTICIACSSELG